MIKSSKLVLIFIIFLPNFSHSITQPSHFHCQSGYFFDDIALNCTSCPANQTSLNTFSCKCSSAFREENGECIACPDNHISSTDRMICLKCPDDAPFDSESNYCSQCKNGSILIDRSMNGTLFSQYECITCTKGTVPNHSKNRCVPCDSSYQPDKGCQCDSSSTNLHDKCVPLSELSDIPDRESSYTVHFKATTIKSDFLKTFYRYAAHGCKFERNRTLCHMLANMCTLLHFSYDNELNACSFYRTYFGKNLIDAPEHAPSLYYDSSETLNILNYGGISAIYSFKPRMTNSILNFTVAKYSLDGRLMNYGSIDKYLELCPTIMTNMKSILQFGKNSISNCQLPVNNIWNDYDTYFYEIYLNYVNLETSNSESYSVPILNRNYQLQNSFINQFRKQNWQLLKRFFIFDNISGKEHGYSGKPAIVRYLRSFEIEVNMQSRSVDGLIYPPIIILHYEEISVNRISSTDAVSVTLEVKYTMDQKDSWRDISISVGIMSMFAILWSLIETYSWGKRCGKIGVDLSGLVQLILISCGNLSNIIFLVQFCTCLYWLIIFKGQDVVFLILPTRDEEFTYKQYLIAAFFLKCVHLTFILYEQMTLDLFLIDWEKPRAKNTIPHPHLSKKKVREEMPSCVDDDSVSIWRIYFVANEWNEIQTFRKTNLFFQLITVLFILKVMNFEQYTTYDPNSESLQTGVISPYSFICRFSVSIAVYLSVITAQLLFRSAFYERYIENKLQQFVDLCSMANISVFILQMPLYGYYIHGRSVHGFADSNMKTFYENLRREEEDLCAYRGLEASSDCQTFEVITTYKFRDEYSNILRFTSDQLGSAPQQNNPRRSKINAWKIEQTVRSHERMKNFFEMFLQHSSSEFDYVIKDKLFLETIFDIELQDVEEKCLFFKDSNFLFNRVLFYGQESILIVFEMLLFTFVDMLSYDYTLSAIITYVVAYTIRIIRNSGGKRNLVKKTLVDSRFLI